MFQTCLALRRGVSTRGPSPLEMFSQLQQGITPPIALQRAFLSEHFREDLTKKGIHDAKLGAMDLRTCSRFLRNVVFERYLAVPLRLFTFDMEFTNIPTFTAEGPTADITEIGVYNPLRDERLSVLVHSPGDREMPEAVVKLTGITNEQLQREGVPFPEAWRRVSEFLGAPEPNELEGSDGRLLLLSHGGKLADVSMLQWAWRKYQIAVPKEVVFGDTFNLIRDAHRRRPVTPDKHPPSWRLSDLVTWLKVESQESAHRAGDDAKLTWDALFHTLDRYGEETLSPRQQLILRFFDTVAKEQLQISSSTGGSSDAATLGSLDLDAVFSSVRASSSSAASSSSSASSNDTTKRRSGRRVAERDSDASDNTKSETQKKERRVVARGKAKKMFAETGVKKSSAQAAVFISASDVTTDVPDL